MAPNPLVPALDELLSWHGFRRNKQTWHRDVDGFVDLIDLQASKSGDAATLNVAVLDPLVYEKLWGATPTSRPREEDGTVRARIGQLIDGRDLWWELNDPAAAADVTDKASHYALPFLERMHSRSAMAKHLSDQGVERQPYPPPAISLAILRDVLGDREGACALLDELRRRTVQAWQERVAEVAARLECGAQR